MIRSMEEFFFVIFTTLDLNMGYYHIKLNDDADLQNLCTIVFHGTWENTNTNDYPWVSTLPGS
jgi:hypothetical protein